MARHAGPANDANATNAAQPWYTLRGACDLASQPRANTNCGATHAGNEHAKVLEASAVQSTDVGQVGHHR